MKPLNLLCSLLIFQFCLCAFAADESFGFSTPKNGNTYWHNQYFQLANFSDKNQLMSIMDRRDGKTLLTRSWLWYAGKSGDTNQLYQEYSEETNLLYLDCYEERKAEHQTVTTRYESPDFELSRQTRLYKEKPYLRLRYTLKKRHKLVPSLQFPLLVFPKSFDQVVFNTENGFSEIMPFEQVTAPMLEKTHLLFLINKSLGRTIILMSNLNAPLDLGYDLGSNLTLSSSWGNFVKVGHPYKQNRAESFEEQPFLQAEVYFALHQGVEFNHEMKALAAELEQSFNLQPRFQDYRFTTQVEEQLKASADASLLAKDESLTLWHESSLKKVYPNTASPVHSSSLVQLKSAQNEGESFQLVLNAKPGTSLQELTVSVPRQPEGGAQLPPLKAYWLEFQKTPSVAVAASGLSGLIADKLLPIEQALPRTLPEHSNQPLWLTADIPYGAEPGLYHTEITLVLLDEAGQRSKYNVALQIEVWDFALPKQQPYRAFGVGWHAGDVQSAELLARYKFNNTLPALDGQNKPLSLKKAFDWQNHDKIYMDGFFPLAKKAVEEWNYNSICLPYGFIGNVFWTPKTKTIFGGLTVDSEEFTRSYPAYVALVAKQLKNTGLLEKSFVYMWDEVLPQHYEAMRKTVAMCREVAAGLKILIVGVPNPEVIECADIIVPGGYYLWWDENSPAMIEKSRQAGKEFWLYDNGRTFARNASAADTRLVPWQSWPRGISGYLQWAMGADWDKSYATNGQTWLIYPKNAGEPPIASLRLEIFRDGIEDYCYFEMMKTLPQKFQKEMYEEILSVVPLQGDPKADLLKMRQIRDRIGNALSQANSK